ncbi:uncharacterized protein LOC102801012 [Saccoglossus kowalevskii]|uniref:Uncharacterized protein LOC102801012 n=1 Tax=Saccoglossus kowalevskii TaxID=10224 RepID=A0ABM0MMB1_SACKO|nr:PREDICTED: uncharacterized protein LOC102801012 [Saccoglossus kowalevskii]
MFIRNRNRPHNAKMRFHEENDQPLKQGYSLMRQFWKCVGGFSLRLENEFHKCCKSAYMEQQKTSFRERSKVDTEGALKHSKHRDRNDYGDRAKEEELLLIQRVHNDRVREEELRSMRRNHDDQAKEEELLSMLRGHY